MKNKKQKKVFLMKNIDLFSFFFLLVTLNDNSFQMNLIARVLWILLNVLFGASLAYILFIWVACDMEIPSFLMDFLDEYIPAIKPIFQVPYIKINQISSSISSKLLFNAFLYAIFGFIHTLFAQEFVQSFLGHFLFPKQTLRTVYNLLVTITVFIIIGFWQHTEVQLWNFLPNTMTKYQQHMLLLMIHTIFHVPGRRMLKTAK